MKTVCTDISMLKRGLVEIHKTRKGLISLVIVNALCIALFPFINIYMSAFIIDKIVEGKNVRQLVWYVSITTILNLLISLIKCILKRYVNLFRFELESRLSMKMFQKMMDMDYINVENPEVHHKRVKIDEYKNMNKAGIGRLLDVFSTAISSLFSMCFSVALTVSLFATVGYSKYEGFHSFVMSPVFSFILIVVIIIYTINKIVINERITRKKYSMMNDIIPFNRIFGYYLENYIGTYHAGKDIRIYHQQDVIEEETKSLFDDVYIILDKLSNNQILYSSLIILSSMILNVCIHIFVCLKALMGAFGVGLIVQYIGSINVFTQSLANFMKDFSVLHGNTEALIAYFDYMDIPSVNRLGNLPICTSSSDNSDKKHFEIEFCNVSFKYPSTNSYALKNVSLKIKYGERIAIVGENGSGKTTFAKLVCRLYDPTEGVIRLNGVDIREYSYDEYIKLLSVVFQDYKLLSFGLGQNIATSTKYDKSRAKKCLDAVGFFDSLSKNSVNIESCLYKDFDKNGIEISGGEAQKIALARAIYKDAPFIILDEPTAALDPIAEYDIYTKFNEIIGDKTAIYISHRLSSCRFCDNIAVFDNGQIIQHGSHAELVANKNGKYYELWHAQAQYYE